MMKNKLMRGIFTVFALSVFVFYGFSQDVELSNRLINEFNGYKNSSNNKSINTYSGYCPTPTINEAIRNFENLTPNAKDFFKKITARPTLINEKIFKSKYFDIHYTIKGVDSVSVIDLDQNSIPDYIDKMGRIFDSVYVFYVNLGYAIPPADKGNGGSTKYDVYCYQSLFTNGYNGMCSPETSIGDNPNSTIKENASYSSFISMLNTYNKSHVTTEDNALRTTAAHEYFHAISFGYTNTSTSWFAEMTASWSEGLVYPLVYDHIKFIPSFINEPDVSLTASVLTGYQVHAYGSWIFTQFITEKTNNSFVKRLLERTILEYELDAIDNELKANWNTTLYKTFEEFCIANLVLSKDTMYYPYIYKNGNYYNNIMSTYGGVVYETRQKFTGNKIVFSSNVKGNSKLQKLSVDNIYLTADRNFVLTLTRNNSSSDIDIVLVKVNVGGKKCVVQHSVTKGTNKVIEVTDKALYNVFYLEVIRYDRKVSGSASEYYNLSIETYTNDVNEIYKPQATFSPNPVETSAHFNFMPEVQYPCTFKLYDNLGRIISVKDNIFSDFDFNRQSISNGIYNFTITNRNKKQIFNGKIILK